LGASEFGTKGHDQIRGSATISGATRLLAIIGDPLSPARIPAAQ
jgi:hypothetical protein